MTYWLDDFSSSPNDDRIIIKIIFQNAVPLGFTKASI